MRVLLLSFLTLISTFSVFGNEGVPNDLKIGKKSNKILNKEKKKNKFLFALSKIDLSDEQKTLLKDLLGEAVGTSNKKKLRDLKKKMDDIFASDANEDEVIKIQNEIQTLQDEKRGKSLSNLIKIRKVLTVEQRKKFIKILNMSKKGGKRRHKTRYDRKEGRGKMKKRSNTNL